VGLAEWSGTNSGSETNPDAGMPDPAAVLEYVMTFAEVGDENRVVASSIPACTVVLIAQRSRMYFLTLWASTSAA
jgi:hypothetical protein